VSVEFAALLYAGDRYESRDHLLTLIATHDLVILDRYVSSNIAYGAAKRAPAKQAKVIEWIREVEYGIFELPKPDLICLMATRVQVAHELVGRKETRSYTEDSHDIHEADSSFLDRVAEVYRRLGEEEWESPWMVIDPHKEDGTLRDPKALQKEVWQRIAPMI